jgi:CPA1 family monovalent cation:H+ antiporter
MLEISVILLCLLVACTLIEQYLKVPRTVSLLTIALIDNFFGHSILNIQDKDFDSIILLLLPLFITADALMLTLEDLKANALSLLYTALVSIILSIGVGVLLNTVIFPDYNIPTSALVMLFCMVLATDPITVTSVFGNFKLPHKLKIIAEGESLFNDAFALIIFFIALKVYNGAELTTVSLITFSGTIILGSVLIGLICGAISLYLLQMTNDSNAETAILLASAYGSFLLAEHFHWAGILSIIVSVITAKTVIDKRIKDSNNEIIEEESKTVINFLKLNSDLVNVENQKMIKKFVNFLASLAGVVLFISMGEVMNIELMFVYWKEILSVFIAITFIRGAMMSKFAWISNKTTKMEDISLHWWKVLTFAGVKGGLSILMVHFLPHDFEFKDLFEAVVFGNIILSTFVYSLNLTIVISMNKKKFEKECALESH